MGETRAVLRAKVYARRRSAQGKFRAFSPGGGNAYPSPMLAPALRRLIEEKHTHAKELAQVAGVAQSTVYRWLDGESEPDFSHLSRLLSGLHDVLAREGLLLALLEGSGFGAHRESLELDVNRDGVVDHHDAIAAVCGAIGHTTDSLQAIHETSRGRRLSEQELADARALLQAAIVQCATTRAVLSEMHKGRKPAKA